MREKLIFSNIQELTKFVTHELSLKKSLDTVRRGKQKQKQKINLKDDAELYKSGIT